MKYVIIGKHEAKGVVGDDDDGNFNLYYELGWELVISNIIAKKMLHDGMLSPTDIIVTKDEREFIYSNFFDNVIDWNTFKNVKTENDEIYYLPRTLGENVKYGFGVSNPENLSSDITCNFDLISDIEEKYDISSSFGIYCIRLRDWCDWRNSDINVAKKVISKFNNELGIKMFVVGQNSEDLAKELNVNYINLREYASLMNSKYCKFCISPLSGIVHLTNFCGHENLYNLIFDRKGERGVEDHPCYMGNNINYKKVKNIFIREIETENRIFELYNTYIKD
ncbi:MAG: hypothetical protein ACO3CQ_00565 [Candidatus Nanopelagicaceae bacterium]